MSVRSPEGAASRAPTNDKTKDKDKDKDKDRQRRLSFGAQGEQRVGATGENATRGRKKSQKPHAQRRRPPRRRHPATATSKTPAGCPSWLRTSRRYLWFVVAQAQIALIGSAVRGRFIALIEVLLVGCRRGRYGSCVVSLPIVNFCSCVNSSLLCFCEMLI